MGKGSANPAKAGMTPGKGAASAERQLARQTNGPTSYGKASGATGNAGHPSKAVALLKRTAPHCG